MPGTTRSIRLGCILAAGLCLPWMVVEAAPSLSVVIPNGPQSECVNEAYPVRDVVINVSGLEPEDRYRVEFTPSVSGWKYRPVRVRERGEVEQLLLKEVRIGDYEIKLTNKGDTLTSAALSIEPPNIVMNAPNQVAADEKLKVSVSDVAERRVSTGSVPFGGVLRLVVVPSYYPADEFSGKRTFQTRLKECADSEIEVDGLPIGDYEIRVLLTSSRVDQILHKQALRVADVDADPTGENPLPSEDPETEPNPNASNNAISENKIDEIRSLAQILEGASTSAEIISAFSDLFSALMTFKDAAELAGVLNQLKFTPKAVTIAELEKDVLGVAMNIMADYLYDRAAKNGIEMIVPQEVFEAVAHNAVFVSTGDLKGSLTYLGGQFVDIVEAYTALNSNYSELIVSQFEYALLELEAFRTGDLDYEFVLKQIIEDRNLSIGIVGADGGEWSVAAIEKMGAIADLQELKLRMLDGQDVQTLIASMRQQYADDAFAANVASLLGLPGWP